jgi:hypothetical protein
MYGVEVVGAVRTSSLPFCPNAVRLINAASATNNFFIGLHNNIKASRNN